MNPLLDIFDPGLFPLHLVLAFVFGSLWGSFFGLCIARIPAGQSIVMPNSYCFACGQTIHWHDNIPLLSYWLLRGRCRRCGTVFGIRHFVIELLSGLLFAWVFWERGYTPTILVSWIFTGLLVIATFTDLDHWIIPDRISLGGVVIGLVLALIPFPHTSAHIVWAAGPFPFYEDFYWTPLANAAIGAAFGYGIMWLIGRIGSWIFRKEAMGGGDMKLLACIGAFLGFVNCIYVLFLSSVLGVLFGIAILIFDKVRQRRQLAAMEEEEVGDADELATRALYALYPEIESQKPEFLIQEKNTLLSVLTRRPAVRAMRHHLPFGPYLAAAAFLVMLYHREIENLLGIYVNFFEGY